jgi:quinol-cytochrome oxidoreductase complex cytochrome b subunit
MIYTAIAIAFVIACVVLGVRGHERPETSRRAAILAAVITTVQFGLLVWR